MKTRQILTAFLMAFASLTILQAQNDTEKPYLTKTFSPTGLTNIKTETSGGNVSVYGQNSGDARIEVYIRANNWNQKISESEIKERLEKYTIQIDKDANTLTAIAKPLESGWKWGWKDGLSISFKIYVPNNITSNLRTSGGNIKLSNLSGNQDVKTSGGNISLSTIKGIVDAETSGGNIDIDGFNGTIDAQTSGGNVKVENSKGSLKIGTSGGNIRIAQVGGSLEAHTSGGNVTADISSLEKYLTLSTSGGNITVKMPMDKGMDLDLSGDRVSVAMQNFDGTIKDDRVKGKLNGGGIPVRISTSGGNVRIN